MRYSHVLCLFSFLSLYACQDTFNAVDSKNNAISAANEVAIICDDKLWEDEPVNDTLMYYFEAPYPIMPQPEPMFDVRHFSTEDLAAAPLRRELRTYVILADLDDQESETTHLVKSDLGEEKLRHAREDTTYVTTAGLDRWARGQLVVYVFGFGKEALIGNLVKAFPAIAKRIHEHDAPLIDAATYMSRESYPIAQRIREKFNVEIKIPGDYKIALDKDNFLWIREDFDETISGITIMTFPYQSKDQLDLGGFIKMQDRMGYMVEGASPGSFMTTNDEDLPVYLYKKEIDGHYAVEGRGIWELTEDFLGGPFVTYAIVDGSRILMINTFVHAPSKDKRNYVQRLEHIVSTLKFRGP